MNNIIQTMLVFAALAFAVTFLVKKFVWKKPAKATKRCGSEDCGCR